MHARWGRNEWANWVSLLQKWSGVLVCGTRWKENGRGRPPKNIVQELFCQNECASGGNRKRQREGNRVGSFWARMVWSQGESERERRRREELKVSEWEIRHNYRLTASPDNFSEGTPWTGERTEGGGRPACDSEKGCLFDWPCGCFPTWQPPVRSIATTPSTCPPQGDSSAQRIISIKWEPDTCPYHRRYQGNGLGFPGHANTQNLRCADRWS